ncbi:hypothetical protein [Arthrobacter sp. efr-133-TYG-118]|uniref:hypothetical protein n=1 Tax=Arthrobacter sp. efr-133-TYG-118 TaxID=3040279 RepID=UPI00254F6653|nr:hypothetical protein [Arthrobacter sp. efr-133-TYG-118]
MNPKHFYPGASFGVQGPITHLQRVILDRTPGRTVRYSPDSGVEIIADLGYVADAVESAFVLVPREALPKIGRTNTTVNGGSFTTAAGENIQLNDGADAEKVRKVAATWLAVAALLESEEKAKADEAKKKEAAEAAAKIARTTRLEQLADEYFEEYFEELGPKKTRVIEELYRLEEEAADSECCGCDD